MPCDTRLKPRQTIQQRATEVRDVVEKFGKGLATGRIKPVVDRKTGAIAFDGVTNEERDGVTDACAYRRLMVTGSALAKNAIQRAEQMAGRAVDKRALAHGHHSHDGGKTWHHGH
jgi:hypothetical protein